MAGIANDVKQIRQALYGREVREAIAHGIEQCYSDVAASKTVADTAAAAANTATQNAQTATQQANQARDNAQAVADGVVNQSITAINDAAAQQRQSVNDLGDQLKSYMSEHYSETITKAEAKANRSSVSTVKHAIGADGQLTLTDALNEPAKKMMTHLKPKQDFHGYDHPWVGGTGKNLFINRLVQFASGNLTATRNDDGSVTLVASTATTAQLIFHLSKENGIATTSDGDAWAAGTYKLSCFQTSPTGGMHCQAFDYVKNTYIAQSANVGFSEFTLESDTRLSIRVAVPSGWSGTFTIYPMICKPTETDPTYEPYSNICPIEGFDSVEVVSTGKNIFNMVMVGREANGITFTPKDNGLVKLSGTSTAFASRNSETFSLPIGNYTVVSEYRRNEVSIGYDGTCDVVIREDGYSTNLVANFGSFSVTDPNTKYFMCIGVSSGKTIADSDNYEAGCMICRSDDVADVYESFGNSVSLNLVSSAGSTVYGGTVTVNEDGSGTLVVDKGCRKVNDSAWRTGTDETSSLNYFFTEDVFDIPGAAVITSDRYVNTASGLVGRTHGTIGRNGGTRLYINDQNYSDVSAFLAAVGDSKYYYDLAAPKIYNLTATQLRTIINKNYIFTDGTSIELDYYADKYGLADHLLAAFPKDTATGNPASFIDGADDLPLEKLEVAVEPKQDLHGFDRPWACGAGKNLLPITVDRIKALNTNVVWNNNVGTTAGVDFSIITDNDDNVIGINVNGKSTSNKAFFLYRESANDEHVLNVDTEYTLTNGVDVDVGVPGIRLDISDDISSTIVANKSFTFSQQYISNGWHSKIFIYANTSFDNVVIKPMIRLASETDSTFVPYSNICSINGWDKVKVTRRGKNLADFVNNMGIQQDGTVAAHNGRISTVNPIPIRSGSSYRYVSNGYLGILSVFNGDTLVRRIANISTNMILDTSGGDRFYFCCYDNTTIEAAKAMIMDSSETDTSYEPYQGSTLSIPIKSISGSTVYGGTLTVNQDGSGELVVDKAMVDLGTLAWGKVSDRFMAENVSPRPRVVSSWNASESTTKCSLYKYGVVTSGNGVDKAIGIYNGALCARDTSYTTADEFKAGCAGGQVVYLLDTPSTYQITAPQIATLLGNNTIWCDAGEVTVTYHADPTLFITKKIAQALNA